MVIHPQQGTIPSLAACAADKQGKFKPMYELIWEKGFKAGRNFSRENMETLAQEVGLDLNKFKADMDGVCQQLIKQDQADVQKVGASGTPAFFINGRYLSGAQPVESFKRIIDEELKKANDIIAKGEATPANYYEKIVLGKGLKELAPAGAEPPPGGAPPSGGTPQPPGPPPPGKTTWSPEHGHWH